MIEVIVNVLTVTAGVALYYFAESAYYHIMRRMDDRRLRLEIAAHNQYMHDLAVVNRYKRAKKSENL